MKIRILSWNVRGANDSDNEKNCREKKYLCCLEKV